MIEERITIHDKFQFEIKHGYPLELDHKLTSYDIDTFLFIPSSLGIAPETYGKDRFYRELQTYVRFHTPSFPLDEVAGDPLRRLETGIRNLEQNPGPEAEERLLYRMKMLCCIAKSALRDEQARIGSLHDTAERDAALIRSSRVIDDLLQRFRSLRQGLAALPDERRDAILAEFAFADEYLSLSAEEYAFELLNAFRPDSPVRDHLLDLARREIEHRRAQDFPSIARAKSDNETLLFRRSVLKKHLNSILFLQTHKEPEGRLLEQVTISIAAGAAMLFATAIAFVSQWYYGALSLPFFAILIVSYMFKDRIKELTRAYLTSTVRNHLFDHKTDIYTSKGVRLGTCRESFDFVPPSAVPPEVLQARQRTHITEIENDQAGETVIRYRKLIQINSEAFQQFYQEADIRGLNDITRLNVLPFLRKMDDPKQPLFVLEGNSYKRIYGRRVYHINMIMRHSAAAQSVLERYRIVLTRGGIKRIEPVPVSPAKT